MESESIVNMIIMVVDSIGSRMDNRQGLEWNVYIDNGNDNGFPICSQILFEEHSQTSMMAITVPLTHS